MLIGCQQIQCHKQHSGFILKNNYGDETANNENFANAWIEISLESLKGRNCKQIQCGRNVWIVPTKKPLILDDLPEMVSVSCLNCNGQSDEYHTCTKCDGSGILDKDCGDCRGSGVRGYVRCTKCNGQDPQWPHKFLECPECDNTHPQIEDYDEDTIVGCLDCNLHWHRRQSTCWYCFGTGNFAWRRGKKCNECNGEGTEERNCRDCIDGLARCTDCCSRGCYDI